jgi:tetratricopeptide (TPR) repeat protein
MERAEEHFLKLLTIEEELGRREGMATDYGNLGNIYRTRGEMERAEEHYLKSLAIHQELGRREGMAIQLANLGLLEIDRRNKDAACGH